MQGSESESGGGGGWGAVGTYDADLLPAGMAIAVKVTNGAADPTHSADSNRNRNVPLSSTIKHAST